MRYKLIYLNAQGNLITRYESISYLAFIKHLVFAGMGIGIRSPLFYRFMGYFFEFQQYWGNNPNSFLLPSVSRNDPTEINYISNRIGKAFADHLCKTVLGARFTHNYEDVMVRRGMSRKGKRPDFYCDTLKQQFSVEAKGYSNKTISESEMIEHKAQSQTGGIPVNFSMASVAFNLYNSPIVKFYDPVNEEIPYDTAINLQLRSIYYNGLIESLELISADSDVDEMRDYYSYSVPFTDEKTIRLLVHRAIIQGEYRGNSWLNEIEISNNSERVFIDRDGIGFLNVE